MRDNLLKQYEAFEDEKRLFAAEKEKFADYRRAELEKLEASKREIEELRNIYKAKLEQVERAQRGEESNFNDTYKSGGAFSAVR